MKKKINEFELISVIIPTYSRSNMLSRAIESVQRQTYTNVEIIVVDDNGIGTTNQLATFKSIQDLLKDSRVKYVPNKTNLGGSSARNAGIDFSSGKYVTFLDDDDEYYADKIETQLKFYMDNFPNDNGFINSQVDVYKHGKKLRSTKSSVIESDLIYSAVSERILGTPTFFMPSDIIKKVGGFPIISKGQEWYLSVKLIESGYDFLSMKEATVKVNIHGEGSIFDGNSDNTRKINGINYIYDIQKTYFHSFSRAQRNYIKHRHALSLARAYSTSSMYKSIGLLCRSLFFSVPKRDFFATLYRVFLK